MKNITDSFLSLGYWPSAGSFGFNTDILATNLINHLTLPFQKKSIHQALHLDLLDLLLKYRY